MASNRTAPESVVYILGAGFSAPLGIPVMSDFYMRSQDLFARRPSELAHFGSVFKWVREMATTKNYFSTNLFNIEEILSILEMEDYARGGRRSRRRAFVRYIADVINEFTPVIAPAANQTTVGPWMFTGSQDNTTPYFGFVGSLFGITVRATNATGVFEILRADSDTRYTVITLNYDLVLETVLATINQTCREGSRLEFTGSADTVTRNALLPLGSNSSVPLAKVHGSVEELSIVPPTWRKGETSDLRDAWSVALTALSSANHIRILGYSLPLTDTYFRYLLLKAGTEVDRLKTIDVACWDPTGSVKARYDEFMLFERYRFRNLRTERYLRPVHEAVSRSVSREGNYAVMKMNHLEHAHSHALTLIQIVDVAQHFRAARRSKVR